MKKYTNAPPELEKDDKVKIVRISEGDRFIGFANKAGDWKTEARLDSGEMVDAAEPPKELLGQVGKIFGPVSTDFGFNGYAVGFAPENPLVLPHAVMQTLQEEVPKYRLWLFEPGELEYVKEEEKRTRILVASK